MNGENGVEFYIYVASGADLEVLNVEALESAIEVCG